MRPLKQFAMLAVIAAGLLLSTLPAYCQDEGDERTSYELRMTNDVPSVPVITADMTSPGQALQGDLLMLASDNKDQAQEIRDSLNGVIKELIEKAPEKGSGAGAWYAYAVAAVSIVLNFVQLLTKKKNK